ncbi:MAG: glycoside hydrolase family 28 protein, partial [Terracidiphilus sp.]
ILATPVPLSKGMMHISNVHIWNIKATGARRAFDVSAFPQAPLEDFKLDHIAIQARSAGTVDDAQNWTLANVSIDAADGSKLTFSNSQGITLKDDSGIEAPTPK